MKGGYNLESLLSAMRKEREELNEKFLLWETYVSDLIEKRKDALGGSTNIVELIKAYVRKEWHKKHMGLRSNDEHLLAHLSMMAGVSWGHKRVERTFIWLADTEKENWFIEDYMDRETKYAKKIKVLRPRVKNDEPGSGEVEVAGGASS
jgi:hypothetical protein